jgi:hypothetical protein
VRAQPGSRSTVLDRDTPQRQRRTRRVAWLLIIAMFLSVGGVGLFVLLERLFG